MAQIGRLTAVGISAEASGSRGDAVAPAFWIPRTDFSFADSIEYAVDESSLGRIEARSGGKIINQFSEGSLSGHAYSQSFGILLMGLLGSVSKDNPSGEDAVFEHTFIIANTNTHTSLTVATVGETENRDYPLTMVNNLELNLVLDDYISYSADFVGQKGQSSLVSGADVSYLSTEHEFAPQHVAIKFADTIAELSGVDAVDIQTLNLSFAANVDPYRVLGDVTPKEIYNHQFSITGDMDLIFDSATYRDYVTNGDTKACEIVIVNSDEDIGNAEHPEIKITLSDVQFEDWTPALGNDDLVTQTLSLGANYDLGEVGAGNQGLVEIILTNIYSSNYDGT